MSFFATEYTIHFDDTMAYGSHHFLTAFKVQCAAREAFLFGEKIFDVGGVKQALDRIRLLTVDAYARNLEAACLGDRLAILLTIEEWGRSSGRFCYRVVRDDGRPICAGFQTLVAVAADSGLPTPLPDPLWNAMEAMREIEEPTAEKSFRERILEGGAAGAALFGQGECNAAMGFLSERYPAPQVIGSPAISPSTAVTSETSALAPQAKLDAGPFVASHDSRQVWVFAGQGALDVELLCKRVAAYRAHHPASEEELNACARTVKQLIGGDPEGLMSGEEAACQAAIDQTPSLSQVAIHLQNVLGAKAKERRGAQAAILMGHSFGELAAFEIAGCFDLLTGVKIVCERVLAISHHAPSDGDMLVVSEHRSRVASELALAEAIQVVIAGRNHDQQTVLSGPRDQLQLVANSFRQLHIPCVTIPTPTSFHHPRLRTAAQAWARRIQDLPLKAPVHPLYSPNGRRFISSTDDIAATLTNQLLRPFDLKGAVDDLTASGATQFVDCGSTGSLGNLLAKSGAVVSPPVPVQDPAGSPTPHGADHLLTPGLESHDVDSPPVNGRKRAMETLQPETTSELETPIAIVGQGCLLPASANSPEQLCRAIFEKRTGIVDQRRFDSDWAEDFYSPTLQPDRSTSFLSGRVDDDQIVCPPGVDANAFGHFSRAQRLLCVALAPCVAPLRDVERIACYVGATADGFEDYDIVATLRYAGIDPCSAEIDERLQTKAAAGRSPYSSLQEVLDVTLRPGIQLVMVDAACASSLYAAALGMQALETRQADAVIVGGVFCPGPGNSCLFSQFRGTTSTGCRPFDADADGVVFSEGAAVITLRRLHDAVRQGCSVSALLRGVGLSSDGRSSSANVPQTRGQVLSLQRCYSNYEIDRSSIDAIEAHGTSTPVGDATELITLGQFFGNHSKRDIPVHSLKGVLGHAGWAAGTASLIAACQYLQNGEFPGQANFRRPCDALLGADGHLTVRQDAHPLPPRARLAVDGFGFGGANAHMVVEKYDDDLSIAEFSTASPNRPLETLEKTNSRDGLEWPIQAKEGNRYQSAIQEVAVPSVLNDVTVEASPYESELVVVAWRQLAPETGKRFDRNHALPEKHILLPDLADDMDISQKLAVSLADGILAKLPALNAEMREATSMILAFCGKTERGIEATSRILGPRLKRLLRGHAEAVEKVDAGIGRSRPSGPYTLQCMMPNVASGRAALQLDLNGPNFVVDAGDRTVDAAFDSASLLLGKRQSRVQLCIVAAIQANSFDDSEDEFASAFLVATRRSAAEFGLKPIATVSQLRNSRNGKGEGNGARVRQFIRELQPAFDPAVEQRVPSSLDALSREKSAVGIHTPVWVESERSKSRSEPRPFPSRLAIVLSDPEQSNSLIEEISRRSSQFKLIVTQTEASRTPPPPSDSRASGSICVVDWNNPQSIQHCLDEVAAFDAEMVIGVDFSSSWELQAAMDVTTENPMGEWMFLLAQRLESQLRQDKVELWGLFVDSYEDITHPATGATAGVIKSVRRELKTRMAQAAYTRGLTLSQALDRLNEERNEPGHEAEVVFDGSSRRVRRLQAVSLKNASAATHFLNRDSVVVATGGAQGVTAVLMESVLKRHQCTVVAIGRSIPEPGPLDREDCEGMFYQDYLRQNPKAGGRELKHAYQRSRRSWETHATIQKLQSLGGNFKYYSADVTQPDEVDEVIGQIVSRFGNIDLLVHGAGIQLSKQLKDRSHDEFRKTYSVKVAGLKNLVASSRRNLQRTPAVHILTSAYSIFGNDGQHDYGAANETLDRLCDLGRAQKHFWSSIAWLAWDGIGMTRGTEYQTLAEQRGLSMLTPESGAAFLHQVLEGQSNAAVNVPLSEQECLNYEVETIPGPRGESGSRTQLSHFGLDEMSWLHHHQVRDTPTVPGAWILNRMVEAAMTMTANPEGICAVTAEDVSFFRFIRPVDHHRAPLRVVASQRANGFDVWVLQDLRHSSGALLKKDVVLASARIQFQYQMNDTVGPFPAIPHTVDFLSDPYCSQGHGQVKLSGPFDCLDEIQIHSEGRQARFTWPSDADAMARTITPALLLDATWRVGAMYAQAHNLDLYVPVHIKRITMPLSINTDNTTAANRMRNSWAVCTIRSSRPDVDQDRAFWGLSEARDSAGRLRLVVEHAQAKKLG